MWVTTEGKERRVLLCGNSIIGNTHKELSIMSGPAISLPVNSTCESLVHMPFTYTNQLVGTQVIVIMCCEISPPSVNPVQSSFTCTREHGLWVVFTIGISGTLMTRMKYMSTLPHSLPISRRCGQWGQRSSHTSLWKSCWTHHSKRR